MTGTYNAPLASRLTTAQDVMARRAETVLRTEGLARTDNATQARLNRATLLLWLAAAVSLVLAALGAEVTPLTGWTVLAILCVALLATVVQGRMWAGRRIPLTEAGDERRREAEAFDHYLASVEGETLAWAATQQDLDHAHPAVELLPYAIALGRGADWYERFGAVMRRAAPQDWSTSPSSHAIFRDLQRITRTAPQTTTSGGGGGGFGGGGGGGFGGGGGGSGGGGGGGRSW